MHRRNNTDWLVTVRVADLARLSRVISKALKEETA
jgi:phage terminase large subunit-like protein